MSFLRIKIYYYITPKWRRCCTTHIVWPPADRSSWAYLARGMNLTQKAHKQRVGFPSTGSVARLCVAMLTATLRCVGDDSYSNRSATLLSALVTLPRAHKQPTRAANARRERQVYSSELFTHCIPDCTTATSLQLRTFHTLHS